MAGVNPQEYLSYEKVRTQLQRVSKFKRLVELVGHLYAIQEVRPIGRHYTWYPGQRSELDWTKFGIFLFPDENWNEPQLYFDGFGCDHTTGVIKGFAYTMAPASRDAVRLYRNCVLPKSLWLPPQLQHHAQKWDAFGNELVVAIDNGTDLVAGGTILMFLINGAIVLRMPVSRGDPKGTIERAIKTIETRFVRTLPGYVSKKYAGFDPRFKRMRARAMANAKLTRADYEAKLVPYLLEHNDGEHPVFKKRRMQMYRDGQQQAPLILPTGRTYLRSVFALTYEVKLTRLGVRAENLFFNSDALGEVYDTYTGMVIVKLDPDDVRKVLVLVPRMREPVEAYLKLEKFDDPMPLELIRVLWRRAVAKNGGRDLDDDQIPFALLTEYHLLRAQPATRTPGMTERSDAKAATQAAVMPPSTPPQLAPERLEDLLGDSDIPDEE